MNAETIERLFQRRAIMLHATRGDAFVNQFRQVARRAIEFWFAQEYQDGTYQSQAYRELKWAIDELEEAQANVKP